MNRVLVAIAALLATAACTGELTSDPDLAATPDVSALSDSATLDATPLDSDAISESPIDAPPDYGVTDPGTKGDGDYTIGRARTIATVG